MADLRALIAAALVCIGGAAHAGYAYPADPTGFTRSGGAGFSGYGYATSANDSWYGRIVHQRNGLRVPVPGKPVTMPVSYRLAANAPRIAAGVLFSHPALRTGLGIAAWLGAAKFIWDEASQTWRQLEEKQEGEDGKLWLAAILANQPNPIWRYTKFDACGDAIAYVMSSQNVGGTSFNIYTFKEVRGNQCRAVREFYKNGTQQLVEEVTISDLNSRNKPVTNCPPGWTETPAGCLSPAVDKPQFEDGMVPHPMPQSVPQELPYPTPLPVEPSPGPWINPEPGPDPNHRPLFVPTGDPIPNPDYDPNAQPGPNNQPWLQPGIRLNPSPTPDDPWRLDLQPVNRPQNTNEPMPGPQPEEGPDPGTKPKPDDTQSLCEKHPDIIACQKLDEPKPEKLQEREIPFEFAPETGFNGAGACPAPIVANVAGRSLQFSWQPFCDSLSMARNLILAFAWLCAGFIMLGARAE